MLATIAFFAANAVSPTEYLAIFRDPVADWTDRMFVHYGKPNAKENLELWSITTFEQRGKHPERNPVPGIQFAKDHTDPRAIGTLQGGSELLVLSIEPRATHRTFSTFTIKDGKQSFRVKLPAEDVTEASLTPDGRLLSYVGLDADGGADVYCVDIVRWIAQQKLTEAGEEVKDPIKPVRLSNDGLVEHDIKISRTGRFTAWSTGDAPCRLHLATNDGVSSVIVKKTTGPIFARDFYPGDKYLLWDGFDADDRYMRELPQVGWTNLKTLASLTSFLYVDRVFKPLRAILNADGSVACVSFGPADAPGFPYDGSTVIPIRFTDAGEFPVFTPRAKHQKQYYQLYVDVRMVPVYPPLTDKESPLPHFGPYLGMWMTPHTMPGAGGTIFHPTKPNVFYEAGGHVEPMGERFFGSIAKNRNINELLLLPVPDSKFVDYLGIDTEIRHGLPLR